MPWAMIVRHRVFADFSIAHMMRFRQSIATGEVTLSPAMQHENSLGRERILAVGDNAPDAGMLRTAGRSVAYQPKTKMVQESADHVVHGNMLEILECLGDATN